MPMPTIHINKMEGTTRANLRVTKMNITMISTMTKARQLLASMAKVLAGLAEEVMIPRRIPRLSAISQ